MDAERIKELKRVLHLASCAFACHQKEFTDALSYICELEHHSDAMSAYLNTHDHRLFEAAVQAAKGETPCTKQTTHH